MSIRGGRAARYITSYESFVGVDFSTDPMLVDKNHSPYALNLVADDGGMPEKRPGWRTLYRLEGKINGLFRCEMEGEERFLCHAGTKLWLMDLSGTVPAKHVLLAENLTDTPSCGFFYQEKQYLFTGDRYLVYDGKTVKNVEGYIPTLVVNRMPDGGGDLLESPNLLTPSVKEEFIGNGSARTFRLTRQELDKTPVECELYSVSVHKWETQQEGTGFTVDRSKGTVTFKKAPADSQLVNVRIRYAKTVPGSAEKITRSKNCILYNDGTVFACGGVKGADFRSGYGQPDYFPENGYDLVGSDQSDIMGYCRLGEYLGIIKESSEQDSTIFLRWRDIKNDANGIPRAVYYKKPGIVGVGAVSPRTIGNLVDEPLFLSRQGVFGITSNAITYERTVKNRSVLCDNRLTAEPHPETACAAEWMGRFLVCLNSHCYVLDSRRRSYPYGSAGGHVCECYYWENIPAICFLTVGDDLYFGTEDGRVCRFNTDIPGVNRYNDDGRAIPVVWSTCMDDDGQPTRVKTLDRRGCSVILKPFSRSSVEVCLRTERDVVPHPVSRRDLDIFDWTDIDFSRFTFNANDSAQNVSFSTRVRRYRRLQFIIRSEALNEGFGIFQISKTFCLGKVKR